jgi:hypothetical protein
MSIVDPLATDGRHRCDNCNWEGGAEELKPIRDLASRLDPGGVVPSGECPECGALAYPIKARKRWLFVLEGGLEPGEAIGPVRDEDHQAELILEEMRGNSELLDEHGNDIIYYWIELDGGRPVVGAFAGGYIDELRERVTNEQNPTPRRIKRGRLRPAGA